MTSARHVRHAGLPGTSFFSGSPESAGNLRGAGFSLFRSHRKLHPPPVGARGCLQRPHSLAGTGKSCRLHKAPSAKRPPRVRPCPVQRGAGAPTVLSGSINEAGLWQERSSGRPAATASPLMSSAGPRGAAQPAPGPWSRAWAQNVGSAKPEAKYDLGESEHEEFVKRCQKKNKKTHHIPASLRPCRRDAKKLEN